MYERDWTVFFLRCAKCEASKTQSTTAVISLWQPHALHSYWSLPRSRRGDCYILTVQCSLTKWAEAFAIFNQRAITCSKVPDSIHGDHDRNFESKIFLEICQQLSVNKTRTSTYQPECDSQVENLHYDKTLKGMLKAKVSGSPVTWDEHLNVFMPTSVWWPITVVIIPTRSTPRLCSCLEKRWGYLWMWWWVKTKTIQLTFLHWLRCWCSRGSSRRISRC